MQYLRSIVVLFLSCFILLSFEDKLCPLFEVCPCLLAPSSQVPITPAQEIEKVTSEFLSAYDLYQVDPNDENFNALEKALVDFSDTLKLGTDQEEARKAAFFAYASRDWENQIIFRVPEALLAIFHFNETDADKTYSAKLALRLNEKLFKPLAREPVRSEAGILKAMVDEEWQNFRRHINLNNPDDLYKAHVSLARKGRYAESLEYYLKYITLTPLGNQRDTLWDEFPRTPLHDFLLAHIRDPNLTLPQLEFLFGELLYRLKKNWPKEGRLSKGEVFQHLFEDAELLWDWRNIPALGVRPVDQANNRARLSKVILIHLLGEAGIVGFDLEAQDRFKNKETVAILPPNSRNRGNVEYSLNLYSEFYLAEVFNQPNTIFERSTMGVQLPQAYLRGVDLRGMNLGSFDLRGAFLDEANFSNTNLFLVLLQNASCRAANFEGAESNFFQSVEGINLKGAKGNMPGRYVIKIEAIMEATPKTLSPQLAAEISAFLNARETSNLTDVDLQIPSLRPAGFLGRLRSGLSGIARSLRERFSRTPAEVETSL